MLHNFCKIPINIMEEKMMEDNYGRNLKSEVKGKGGKKYY
jgi:hypothetical protein